MAADMQYRNLGRTGLKVSVLSYGAWVNFNEQLDLEKAKQLMQTARDVGMNFFDNAEAYANGRAEEIMGRAIKELGWKRSDLVISTKLFRGGEGPNDRGLSRKHIIEGAKASLARLDMDYVDLVYCHRPDPSTPIEETVRAMNHLIDTGRAFYWGTSEWSKDQIAQAMDVADRLGMIKPAFEQPEYNMFHRRRVEEEYLDLIEGPGLGLTTWSPLASGVLTGKYSAGNVPAGSRLAMQQYKGLAERKLVQKRAQVDAVDRLQPIAADLDCSLAQMAIAWCAANEHVSSVITGATRPEQIRENAKALKVIPKLTPEVMARIDAIMQPVVDMA